MEEKCKGLFNNLPLGCLLIESCGENLVVRGVNEEYCRLVKKDRKELVNKSVRKIFEHRPVQCETVIASLQQTLMTQKPVVFDYMGYDHQGTQEESFWEVINIPIKKNAGEDTSYILHLPWNKTTEVLEERKRAQIQRELDEKKSENECFIQKSRDGLFSLDAQGNFLSVNAGIVNLADASEEQLLQMSFLPFCAPQHRDQIFSFFCNALRGEDQNFEAEFISCKSRHFVLDVSLMPMKIKGEILGVYGIARDITEIKIFEKTILKQKEQLEGSENKFRALVQQSSDLTGIIDPVGNYKFVSESTNSILGIAPEEFIGKNAFDFIHPEDKEEVMSYLVRLDKEKQVTVPCFRFIGRDGNYRWVETTATNLTNDPFIQGIVTNSRDVTESRQLWAETLKQNKILNEIAWEHAHIVRAPLVRLKSLLDLLEGEDYKMWNREELIRLLRTSAEELDEIILETVRKTEDVEIRQPK